MKLAVMSQGAKAAVASAVAQDGWVEHVFEVDGQRSLPVLMKAHQTSVKNSALGRNTDNIAVWSPTELLGHHFCLSVDWHTGVNVDLVMSGDAIQAVYGTGKGLAFQRPRYAPAAKLLRMVARHDASGAVQNISTRSLRAISDISCEWVPAAEADPSSKILSELYGLQEDWDGEGGQAPTLSALASAAEVVGRLSHRIPDAEVEVDGSSGEITFSWFAEEDRSVLTVTVLPNGRVVVVSAALGQPARRIGLPPEQLERLSRTVADFESPRRDG